MKPHNFTPIPPTGRGQGAAGEGALQPTYEELLHFFNEVPDLLCIAGFDGKFKYLNPAWQFTLGWTAEELQARPFLDFVHPDDRPATLVEMEKLALGVATITFENRYHCSDGSFKRLQWTACPLPGLQATYAIARDVTLQRLLKAEILETLDRERERVGRDLHDGLCQELAGIAALSTSLARRLDPAAPAESGMAREIGKLLGESIGNARDLARGFNPAHLEGSDLNAALAEFCSNTAESFQMTCAFHCEACSARLDNHLKSDLYRIAQEAVSNAISHGRAKRIDVALIYQNDRGTLVIEDDGVGIADPLERKSGIGLHTMAYRSRLMGASFEVNRRTTGGTVVSCMFPLPLPSL
jgi:PAS domain S-box-containing protein